MVLRPRTWEVEKVDSDLKKKQRLDFGVNFRGLRPARRLSSVDASGERLLSRSRKREPMDFRSGNASPPTPPTIFSRIFLCHSKTLQSAVCLVLGEAIPHY